MVSAHLIAICLESKYISLEVLKKVPLLHYGSLGICVICSQESKLRVRSGFSQFNPHKGRLSVPKMILTSEFYNKQFRTHVKWLQTLHPVIIISTMDLYRSKMRLYINTRQATCKHLFSCSEFLRIQ